MKNEEHSHPEGMELSNSIPNELNMPHLHALTMRRNLGVNKNSVVRKSEVDNLTISKKS